MNALAIIGSTVGGAVVGGAIGAFIGDREDRTVQYNFGISTMVVGGIGVIAGGFLGMVAGALKFT